MNRAGDELLAGAAFPGDQDRRPARRGLNDQVEHLLHPRTAPDDAREPLVLRLQGLSQRGVLRHQLPPLDGVADDDQHLVVLERLGDVVERPALHRRDRGLDRREGRDHENRQVVVELLELLERGEPVHAGHHHVDDDRVERKRAGQLEPFLSA